MRVLHLNDCAFVARTLAAAGREASLPWRYLGPDQVRPRVTPRGRLAPLRYLPYVARRAVAVGGSDVVHVHYGTSARLVRERGIPVRPYVLSLHGTDIRTQWHDPRYHDELRRAVDGAAAVLYTNLDTAEVALAARPDAAHLPQAVAWRGLPMWRPAGESGTPRIVFAPRWSADKGVEQQLELAASLRAALPAVDLVGLDWGEGAARAAELGVRLVPTAPHETYLALLASADVVIGQADTILSVSDFEAMLIGAPLAAVGRRLPSQDGTTPPALEGDVAEVTDQVVAALADPRGTAAALDGTDWVRRHHDPAVLVRQLLPVYAAALGTV